MADTAYVIAAIALMGLVTTALRALPFLAGHWLRRHAFVQKLGDSLPLAIMVLLLLDTATGQSRSHPGLPWQEIVAVALVVLLQWRTRQTLLSIAAGTAVYVVLRAV